MVKKVVTVKNPAGIHCRPSSRIMQKVAEYPDCNCNLLTEKGETDLTSILGLMSLGLQNGDEVTLTIEGNDEEKLCKELSELFGSEFEFKQ